MSEKKTNMMRILDRAGADYQVNNYDCGEFVDGTAVADKCGIPYELCFKTLVAFHVEKGVKTEYFVFVIPVDRELDLKAAAASVGKKSVEMLAVKELFKVTGYVRGGCSPLGMKKNFPTVFDVSAKEKPEIYVSGGRLGTQVKVSPQVLCELSNGKFANITSK